MSNSYNNAHSFVSYIVGKKFMRSIHSLKSRPAFPMTLLPHRQSVEPMNPEQPPKKKRIFYDRINEEDSYLSDEGSWDDTSSNHSSTAAATAKTNNTATIRSLFASHHSGNSSKATKRASRGIRDLFQSSYTFKAESQYGTKKKRESISTLFTNNHTRKQVSHPNMVHYILPTNSLNILLYYSQQRKKRKISNLRALFIPLHLPLLHFPLAQLKA